MRSLAIRAAAYDRAAVRLLIRLALLVAAVAVGTLASAAPAAAGTCPAISFLSYGESVYRSYFVPAGVDLPVGEKVGEGVADFPGGDDNCKRERVDVDVDAFAGIDPEIAVAVPDRPRLAFVLGNKCVGYVGAERWSCLRNPLELGGVQYVGAAYPRLPAPRKTLPLGEPIGEATVGGEPVTAVRIDGVDPAVAVGIEGRPSEAFVAVGACPYERFDNRPALDDLRRCLEAPVWLVFVPPGGPPGEKVTARADRPVPADMPISISLVASEALGDIVPRDLTGAVPVGALPSGDAATLAFEIPKLDEGRYEAVATCAGCAATHGGRTMFPAGLFIVSEAGSGTPKVILYALGLALIVLVITAVYVRRKGWIGRARRRPTGPSS